MRHAATARHNIMRTDFLESADTVLPGGVGPHFVPELLPGTRVSKECSPRIAVPVRCQAL